ncbi:carotenoid biosynthesis protein [Rhodococcus marinonascens]|uniref:carotenoid biosynthesis protein n=1 Tax=Rhodococcus marinonascens TaxID=38311 RepID=UPI000932494F|nr:carotenoid biosynthesis protein [Rhodococcus marinonascens]
MTGRLSVFLAAAAVVTQILYPLVQGGARDALTVSVVVLLAAACITHAAATRGARWTAGLVIVTAGLGLSSEVLGTATGYPYGCYAYTADRLGPALAGVPLVVPLAWTAGFYLAWCVASVLARGPLLRPIRILLATIGVVGWDLYLDPQMVADGQWTWCVADAGLPGLEHIPLTNYAGWLLVTVVMAVAVDRIDLLIDHGVNRRIELQVDAAAPRSDGVPIGLFLWTWLGSALAHSVFLGAPELRYSAMYGWIVMGILGVPLLISLMRQRARQPWTYDTRPRT